MNAIFRVGMKGSPVLSLSSYQVFLKTQLTMVIFYLQSGSFILNLFINFLTPRIHFTNKSHQLFLQINSKSTVISHCGLMVKNGIFHRGSGIIFFHPDHCNNLLSGFFQILSTTVQSPDSARVLKWALKRSQIMSLLLKTVQCFLFPFRMWIWAFYFHKNIRSVREGIFYSPMCH